MAEMQKYPAVWTLVAALSLSGCGGGGPSAPEPPSHLPVTELLVGYDLEVPRSYVASRRPLTAWIKTDRGREPAIYLKNDFDLAIRRDGLRGARLRGRYGLVGHGAGRRAARKPTEAIFRVRLSTSASEPGQTLFEGSLSGSSPVFGELDVTIPESAPDNGFLTLAVLYQNRHRQQLTAAWIDPVLVGDRTVPSALPPNPWNVLVITADTTRQDVLSSYGGPAQTAALERLAADGITFSNAFSVAFGTAPSHASLLTASHASDHGVYNNRTALGPEKTALQELLQERGYATSAFVSARPVVRSLGFSRGFDHFDDLLLQDNLSHLGKYSRFERRAEVTASRFIDWLDRREPGPFFSWIHLFDPHQPYAPPPGTATSGDSSPRRTELLHRYFRSKDGQLKYLHLEQLREPQLTAEVDELARDLYRMEIEVMDGQIGRILEALEERDLYRQTLIVFVSDHGENFNERKVTMAFRHAALFSEVSKLPLILKLPESEHAGSTRDFLLGNLDLAPTILDVLGLDTPSTWAGRSFLPLLAGKAGRRFRPHLVLEGVSGQEIAVRTNDWMYRRLLKPSMMRNNAAIYMLAYEPGQMSEIFDLRADPSERTKTDPADCPEYQELLSIADAFLSNQRSLEAESITDPEHLEALKALGYID